MNKKPNACAARAQVRAKIRELRRMRLSVHRTPQHIYAQIFDPKSKVLAAASTLQKDVREGLKGTGNVAAAAAVGKAIAEKAKAAGISRSHSIARASSFTAASRRWPMRRAKTGSSSKAAGRKS